MMKGRPMEDISRILDGWGFDPDDICARTITGLDGRDKLQVRVDLGMLQMELDGRPDGLRPEGHPSLLDRHLSRLAEHEEVHHSDAGFRLSKEDCEALGHEGLQYYHRYVCLMRLGDFSRVVADTEHNLSIFDLVNAYACASHRAAFEQHRPYVLMVHTRARGEMRLAEEDVDGALRVVREGLARIAAFVKEFEGPGVEVDRDELRALESWAEEIEERRPVGLKQRLTQQLEEAIAEEKYERAARIRDRIRGLERPRL
jgi:hypothetical protein